MRFKEKGAEEVCEGLTKRIHRTYIYIEDTMLCLYKNSTLIVMEIPGFILKIKLTWALCSVPLFVQGVSICLGSLFVVPCIIKNLFIIGHIA
jgi:hypothetical protein